jgi:exonuclease V
MLPELQEEIVSDEEMAIIEAALAAAAARPLLSAAAVRGAATLSCAAYSTAGDIEDSAPPLRRSLLSRFRERRALAVTDITATVSRPVPAPFSMLCVLRQMCRVARLCFLA